jgi:D-alanyl-D-alanine carboxypeptidase-like protein
MATSQNGWPVDFSGDRQDHSPIAAGVTAPQGVRRGDVATVLHYVARRFDSEVERLRQGWCWGWYVRRIAGSNTYSNHASGTAIDLNAPDHPAGSTGTFTRTQRTAIGRILDACDGVVRWGGQFTGRKDEMHFEINRGVGAVAALADKIRAEEDALTPEDKAWLQRTVRNIVVEELDKRVGDIVRRYNPDGTWVPMTDPNPTMTVASGVQYTGRDANQTFVDVRDVVIPALERIEEKLPDTGSAE